MALRLPRSWNPQQRLDATIKRAWSDVSGREFLALLADVLDQPAGLPRAVYALQRVQALPYRPDPPGFDDVQTASETARDGGDCEDLAALLVVLCVCARMAARLLWLYQPTRVRDHVTAQVQVDGAWVWAEPTIRAAWGENPYAAADRIGSAERALKLGHRMEAA